MAEDVIPAEPSPAQGNEVEQSNPVESLTGEQRAEWLKTGKLPEPPKEEKSAISEKPKEGEPASGEKPPESAPAPEPEKKPEDGGHRKSGVERRIAELTRARREAERRAEEAERRLAEAGKPKPETQPDQEGRPKIPVVENFKTFDEFEAAKDQYIEALTEWKLEQRDKARQIEAAKAAQTAAETQNRTRKEAWEDRVSRASQKYEDFEDALNAVDVPMSPAMMEYIIAHDRGADLAYYLAKNQTDMERISELVPPAAKRELDKLIPKLDAKTDDKTPPKQKQVTNASKPPTELGGTNAKPEDEVAAAVKDGDFTRYRSEMNRREVKRK